MKMELVSITERGRAQAGAAAEKLRAIRFTHAYASEFPRARQTAAILLRHHDLPLFYFALETELM
jgi:broad specificity phosphatase PhoE